MWCKDFDVWCDVTVVVDAVTSRSFDVVVCEVAVSVEGSF